LNIKTSRRDVRASLFGGAGDDTLNLFGNTGLFSHVSFKKVTKQNITLS
jgi:hypothetical protein